MAARAILRKRFSDPDDLWDLVIWEVPAGPGHPEGLRYRLAYIPCGHARPAVLYDNHRPKGHHKHVAGKESKYEFSGVERLLDDFREDVRDWKKMRGPTR